MLVCCTFALHRESQSEIWFDQIINAYQDILSNVMILGHYEIAEFIENNLNEAYEILKTSPKYK